MIMRNIPSRKELDAGAVPSKVLPARLVAKNLSAGAIGRAAILVQQERRRIDVVVEP